MTKDTEKAFVIIYSEYLRRLSFGTAKNQAVEFEDSKLYAISEFEKWDRADISCAIRELKENGYIEDNICGDVTLLTKGIKYMENKPRQFFESFSGIVKDLLSLVSMFLPI